MKRINVVAFFLALMVAAFAAPSGAANALEVTVRDTDASGRILLDLSYPTPTGDPEPEIEVLANGRPVDVEPSGGGFGGGRSMRSVLVGGARFGMQTLEIAVRVGGETLQEVAHAIFTPRSVILPQWVDDALVLHPPALRLEYRFLNIDTVLVNGLPADFGIEKMMPRDGVTYSGVIITETAVPGTNTVEIHATDWRGDSVAFKSRFVYAPGGAIQTGQVFSLHYGDVGSRSGPFFTAAASSDVLEEVHTATREDGRLVAKWHAAKPGAVSIVIRKKAHFLQAYEIERTIELRVE
jgi:hypothetical protein